MTSANEISLLFPILFCARTLPRRVILVFLFVLSSQALMAQDDDFVFYSDLAGTGIWVGTISNGPRPLKIMTVPG